MVRIIVAGGRDFADYKTLKNSILHILSDLNKREIVLISRGIDDVGDKLIEWISGTADGADTLGERFAEEYGYEVKNFLQNGCKMENITSMQDLKETKRWRYMHQRKELWCIDRILGWRIQRYNMINNAIKYKMEIHVIKYKRG